MSKKSFKDSNPALAFITNTEVVDKDKKDSNNVIDREAQDIDDSMDTQEVQEAQELQEQNNIKKAPKTQGRKGQKLPRINMAFSEDNIEYLRLMSRLKGVSMTQYVNDLLDIDREDNDDIIKKAEKLLDM